MKHYMLSLILFAVFANMQASEKSSHRSVYGYANYDMGDRVTLEDAARACCATKNSCKRVSKMHYYANERKRLASREE
jgi:hypothetical protein